MADVRLIDANVLTDVIEGMDWYHIGLQGNLVHGANSDIHTPLYKADDIYQALKNAPTINPEDYREQGRWEFDSYTAKYGNPYRCSQCKEEHDDTHNYCPNCGARMNGKERTECLNG